MMAAAFDSEASGTCDACGMATVPRGAVWHGVRPIELCAACAPRVMAALVIDSAPAAGPAHVKQLMVEIERHVWRAATFRLARQADRRPVASRN